MIKRCLLAFALGSTYTLFAFALAADPAAAADKYLTLRAGAVHILAARGDANSLAAAAALSFSGSATRIKTDSAADRSAAVELAVKASEIDPDNPSIGWLRLQLCANTPGCDFRDAATTMRWVDADNSAAWLPTLAAAQKDKDSVEVDRILADMAQGVRFDFYWNRTVVLLFDALKKAAGRLPVNYLPSDAARLSEAIGLSAEIIAPIAPVLSACRESAGAERRETCLKLSKVMQRGDTVAAQVAGFNLERRLSPPDSKEARVSAEHKHVLEWRMAAASQFDVPVLPWLKSARARARVAQMRAMPREEDVAIAVLRERRMPLEPSEGHP
jgi:hypothetical protein